MAGVGNRLAEGVESRSWAAGPEESLGAAGGRARRARGPQAGRLCGSMRESADFGWPGGHLADVRFNDDRIPVPDGNLTTGCRIRGGPSDNHRETI